jgi:hypothetical protein
VGLAFIGIWMISKKLRRAAVREVTNAAELPNPVFFTSDGFGADLKKFMMMT